MFFFNNKVNFYLSFIENILFNLKQKKFYLFIRKTKQYIRQYKLMRYLYLKKYIYILIFCEKLRIIFHFSGKVFVQNSENLLLPSLFVKSDDIFTGVKIKSKPFSD
jgi:hypothetical protein